MTILTNNPASLRVTLLVLPDSSMLSLASALDTMRAANRVADRTLFDWQLATLNGKPAQLTCGLPVDADVALDDSLSGDLLIIVAGFHQQQHAGPAHLRLIKRLAGHYAAVCGIEAGSWIMARSGLLDNRAATTHWEDLEEFRNHFPRVRLSAERFVVDGKFFTTGGASPTFDFMLYLIRQRFGYPLAIEVSSAFIHDSEHPAGHTQPLLSLGSLEQVEPRVAAAIHLMELQLDEPVAVDSIATDIGLSVRMLEYLFRQTLDMSPGAYYRRLRLQSARRMITDTRLPLQEIAIRTGFGSLSSFSRSFKHHYRETPGECRRRARAAA